MLLFVLLVLLGALCLLIGAIVFIVGGFRESVAWGLILLFVPILGAVAGYFLGLLQTDWWWMVNLSLHLPWLVFLFMRWEKAKSGFLLMITGLIFYAAAAFSFPAELKPALEAAIVAKTGQPVPPQLAGWLGIKPAAAGAKGATPAVAGAKVDPAAMAAKAVAAAVGVSTITPASSAPANLDTDVQVQAALAELNDRAKSLMARKEALKNSTDQPAIFALAEDIKSFNERLKAVTARQTELNQARNSAAGSAAVAASTTPAPTAAPTAAPATSPAIPPTVVIPVSTPAPTPAPKKK